MSVSFVFPRSVAPCTRAVSASDRQVTEEKEASTTQPPGRVLVVVVLEVVVVCAAERAGRARASARPVMKFLTVMVAPPCFMDQQPGCQNRISAPSRFQHHLPAPPFNHLCTPYIRK